MNDGKSAGRLGRPTVSRRVTVAEITGDEVEGQFVDRQNAHDLLLCGAVTRLNCRCARIGRLKASPGAPGMSERTVNRHPRPVETRHGAAYVLVVCAEMILQEIQGDLLAELDRFCVIRTPVDACKIAP